MPRCTFVFFTSLQFILVSFFRPDAHKKFCHQINFENIRTKREIAVVPVLLFGEFIITTHTAVIEVHTTIKVFVKSVPITYKSGEIEFCEFQIAKIIGTYVVFTSKVSKKIGCTNTKFDVIRMAQIGLLREEVETLCVKHTHRQYS